MSTKVLGVLSLLSVLVIAGAIVFSVLEWQFLAAPPSVWPTP